MTHTGIDVQQVSTGTHSPVYSDSINKFPTCLSDSTNRLETCYTLTSIINHS